MNQIRITITDIEEDVAGDPDLLVQILAIRHLIEEDHPSIRKQKGDTGRILEAGVGIEIAVKKVTKAPGTVVQKVESATGIVLGHVLLTALKEELGLLPEKSPAVVRVVHSLT